MKGKKRHLLARGLTAAYGLALIGYAVWLWFMQADVTSATFSAANEIILSFVLIIGVYLVLLVAHPRIVPSNRRAIAVFGVALIYFAHLNLVDNPDQSVYLRDSISILGALLVITGPMKLLVTKEAEQKKFMQDVEIIEV